MRISRPRPHFYSRPCGRGDAPGSFIVPLSESISTHAPAGGATLRGLIILGAIYDFYSRPCGRGDVDRLAEVVHEPNFYSRPCGRGDQTRPCRQTVRTGFLLTPLREGRRMESSTFPSPSRNFYSRPCGRGDLEQEGVTMEMKIISTHAPAGGATSLACSWSMSIILFLLTPLREGRRSRSPRNGTG